MKIACCSPLADAGRRARSHPRARTPPRARGSSRRPSARRRSARRRRSRSRSASPAPSRRTVGLTGCRRAGRSRGRPATAGRPRRRRSRGRAGGRAGGRSAPSSAASAAGRRSATRSAASWVSVSRIGSCGLWSSSPEMTLSGSTSSAAHSSSSVRPRRSMSRAAAVEVTTQVLARGRVSNQNSWFSPPKTSLTLSSVKMRRIESVSSSAQLSTRRLSGAPARSGIVSVTTICSKPEAARFS